MELREILRAGRRWWWLAALPVLVVGAYLAVTYRPPPVLYQVVMRFTAGSRPADTLSSDYDRYYAWLSSEYIANGLADVAVTGSFAEAVTERLATRGISVVPGTIQGAIVTDNAQSVLVVYLTWPNPAEAIAIAEGITAELTENGSAYYPQLAELGVVAHRVDAPNPQPLPTSLRARLLEPALRLLLAAAVGAGLVLLAHYIDPWVHDTTDVIALDVPIMAVIPRRRQRTRL